MIVAKDGTHRFRSVRDVVLHVTDTDSPCNIQLMAKKEFANNLLYYHNVRPAYPITELEMIQEWPPKKRGCWQCSGLGGGYCTACDPMLPHNWPEDAS